MHGANYPHQVRPAHPSKPHDLRAENMLAFHRTKPRDLGRGGRPKFFYAADALAFGISAMQKKVFSLPPRSAAYLYTLLSTAVYNQCTP
jgi:hypothetical protein